MTIPTNVILVWSGTNATIPSGFIREGTLDGKFPKAVNAGDQNATSGSNTHSHTSPTHYHVLADHTHTYNLNGQGTETNDRGGDPGHKMANTSHSHSSNTTSTTGTPNSSSVAITYDTTTLNSLPPFYEVIFVKATSPVSPPENIIGFYSDSSLPNNWHICDGGSGSPDLRGKYLRGAGTGADAGGTGGATTHSHNISHTHTGASHTHGGTSNASDNGGADGDSGGTANLDNRHGHTVTLNASESPISANADTTKALSDTVEPLYIKLHAIQKEAAGTAAVGLIGLFLEDISTLSAGWKVCDGTNGTPDLIDYHIKIATNSGELLTTGGSNTHTHEATSHSHASGGTHTHSGASAAHTKTQSIDGAGGDTTHRDADAHAATSVQTVNASHADANTTADSSNNEPAYRTALFVQGQYESDVGRGSFNFI